MKIIIHIGTHKTGTSSIQNFLASNLEQLSRQKIYYPLGPYSGRNINFIASRLVSGKTAEVQDFFKTAINYADTKGLETVLVSAESLYAMTAFFRALQGISVVDYWKHEKECITRLANILPDIDISVYCYLRRQDEFIESIYNQFVKQACGYSGNISNFIKQSDPVADYFHHLELWSEIFGNSAIHARRFDDAGRQLIPDFMHYVLSIDDMDGFTTLNKLVNERLNMQVLEFKRILNKIKQHPSESYVSSRILRKISNDMDNQNLDYSLFDICDRQKILSSFETGNSRLAKTYLNPPEDILFVQPLEEEDTSKKWVGLDTTSALQIFYLYRNAVNKLPVRLEIFFRSNVNDLLRRFPQLEHMIIGIRKYISRRRVRQEREGLV